MIDAIAKINQARALFESGRTEQSRALLERALRQHPGHPDLCNAMSLVQFAMGRADLALYHSERAVRGRPEDAAFKLNLANAYAGLNRDDEAVAAYRRALQLDPTITGARLGLSHILRLRLHFAEATEQLRLALQVRPDDLELVSALAALLLKQARVEEAVEILEQGLALRSEDRGCATTLAHCLNYMPGADGARVLAAQRACGRVQAALRPSRWENHPNTPEPDRRIRVGLLSGDLRRHAIAFFIEPFLQHFDRASMEVMCYSTGTGADEVTARLQSCANGWKDLHAQSFEKRAEVIWRDRVDILIDLAGNVAGHNMPVLVMKPAPVQVNYLGYPSSTGIAEIDYRIVDSLTDPEGHDAHASEKLVRIDPSFLCYRPPHEHRPFNTVDGRMTFASFNSVPKINREVVRLWSRLLRETPGSRLLLKALEFGDEPLGPDLVRRFEAEGVDPLRIEISKQKASFEEHLEAYAQVDVALDPFPYNGTTTTFEALSMGVPVVTLRGDRHVSRVSGAILTHLGLTDLIARDEDDYIRIARALAADLPRRKELRAGLRARLERSVLCDGPAFADRLGAALRTMWREWCSRRRAGGLD